MHFVTSIGLLAGSVVVGSKAYTVASTTPTDLLAHAGLNNLIAFSKSSNSSTNCTVSNAAVRREWGSLSKPQRKDYINAVLCLMERPSKSDPALVPGARSRYDDFLAVHINQTLTIHGTANFLSWHRYFVWTYETALRDECGYEGYQPYWNWGKYAFDPVNSPIFDGSEYSMSGNGVYEPHNCTQALPTLINCVPPGNGGGCLASGPFENSTVNLGPIAPTLVVPGVESIGLNFSYNPHCIRRDISSWVSSNWTKDSDSHTLITRKTDISSFQTYMQGDFATGFYGVHTAGHFTIGGDPGGDIFASPGDPVFWLHHGNIDRTWWIWQNQALQERLNAIGDTITLNNNPPSRNGTLEDVIDLGVLAEAREIRDLMSTLNGPFCYIYL